MIPLAVPNLAGNEARYLQECITSGFVSSVGPFVTRFEHMLAEATVSSRAVATSSGTTGLHLALVTVGVASGDLVILPTLTFIASANAIAQAGASPWLLDISAESWGLDPDLLARALTEETEPGPDGRPRHRATGRRVAAILPVYAIGLPADMDRIAAIAAQHGLPIVADAAAAIGARYRGRPLGQLAATLSVISFNGNKTLTTGSGGAVIGNDGDLMALARHLSTTARIGADYTHDRIGFNYRMSNVEAALGCAQLERMAELVAAKIRIDRTYRAAFSDLSDIGFFPAPDWAQGSCWLSGFVLGPARANAAEFSAALAEHGIEARSFWKPIHLQVPYAGSLRSETPVADDFWRRIVTLPCSTALTEREQRDVIAGVRDVLAR
jgi:perosamine synthetase